MVSSLTELRKQMAALSKELQELRGCLSAAHEEKERAFRQKDALRKGILDSLEKIRALKKQRDAETAAVRQLKEKRNTLSGTIGGRMADVNRARGISRPVRSPHLIRDQLEQLEQKVETEALSPEAERRVMERIKLLKKQLGEVQAASSAWQRAREVSTEFAQLKREADVVHAEVQQRAQRSQQHHEEMVATSGKLTELRKQHEITDAKFRAAKEEFSRINALVKEKLAALQQLSGEREQQESAAEEARLDEARQSRDAIEKLLEEKMKQGKKLTTRDLLLLQEGNT